MLPGEDAEQIVVAARYEQRDPSHDAAQGWSEAVMLPLLYNAMLAAKRQHTFVFAELGGGAGQDAFLESMRKKRRPSPIAMVVLDALGQSGPWFYTLEGTPVSAKSRERAAMSKRLESEAVFAARLQGIPIASTAPTREAENTLLFESDPIPSILIYSWFDWKDRAPASEGVPPGL